MLMGTSVEVWKGRSKGAESEFSVIHKSLSLAVMAGYLEVIYT